MRVLGPFLPTSLPGAGLPWKQMQSGFPEKPVSAGKATLVTPLLVSLLSSLDTLQVLCMKGSLKTDVTAF